MKYMCGLEFCCCCVITWYLGTGLLKTPTELEAASVSTVFQVWRLKPVFNDKKSVPPIVCSFSYTIE